jgi:diaminopimelate decarboxylase
MSLPGAPWLERVQGDLQFDGCALATLAQDYGTPLYVYSRGAICEAVHAYQFALVGRDHLLCYAMKANSTLAILQTLAAEGCGFDIVSGGELERVLAAGGDPSKVIFSGVGKTRAEMARALEVGVLCFNVESEAELDVLSAVATECDLKASISLRINPDVDPGTHPYISTGLKGNKFGVAHARAVAAYKHAAQLPGLRVVGIDCHIGSQITQVEPYLDALDRLLDLVEEVEAAGIAIHHVDVGGGLGITYTDETPPRADTLVSALLARLDARGHGHRTVMLEPGRSLVGNAGVMLTEVLYLKPGEAKNFCVVDAAMNDMLRPTLYNAFLQIEPCIAREGEPSTYDVVGPVCESGDWLGRERPLTVAPGDYLAVLSAGAYGMAMASNYNSRPRAAEVLVDAGRAALIRDRERIEDLLARERLLVP